MSALLSPIVSNILNQAAANSLALIAIVVLFALLLMKEITTVYRNKNTQRWGRMLNIAIAPLLIAFTIILVVNVLDALK